MTIHDPFEHMRRERAALDATLSLQPQVELFGIVKPAGVASVQMQGDPAPTLVIQLAAWRISTGKVSRRPLTLRKPIKPAEFSALRPRLTDHKIIHVRARVLDNPAKGEADGALIDILSDDSNDAALLEIAAKLATPKHHTDARFGRLVFNPKTEWFEGQASWGDETIKLLIEPSRAFTLEAGLAMANAVFDAQPTWHERMLARVTDELLDTKNTAWLEDDEAPLTAGAFKARLRVSSVKFDEADSFAFYLNPTDMFSDHEIMVACSPDGTVVDVDLVG